MSNKYNSTLCELQTKEYRKMSTPPIKSICFSQWMNSSRLLDDITCWSFPFTVGKVDVFMITHCALIQINVRGGGDFSSGIFFFQKAWNLLSIYIYTCTWKNNQYAVTIMSVSEPEALHWQLQPPYCLTGMQIPQTGTNVHFIVVYGKPGCYKNTTIGCFHRAWDFRQTLQW